MSDMTTSAADAAADPSDSSPHVVAVVANEAATQRVFIEVCQGPDCYGLGGGAALLEIEELCREYQYCHHNTHENASTSAVARVVVQRGGCRNYCTMGPNVHCQGKQFVKIKSIRDCVNIMDQIFHNHHLPSTTATTDTSPTSLLLSSSSSYSSTTGIAQRMRGQRASRERWTFLRNVAAAQKSKDRKRVESLRRELLENVNVVGNHNGGNAIQEDDAASERIARRRQRYEEFITDIVIQDDNDNSKNSLDVNVDNDHGFPQID
eukprot:scaffold4510_cov183-Amphora_coffeaeformis.AAC.33